MIRIDDRLVKNNLKKGWTTEDFAGYCEISVDEFMAYLQKNFSRNFFDSVVRDLKRNEKNRKRAEKNALNKLQKSVQDRENKLVEVEKSEQRMDELLKKEKSLKDAVISQEKQCKVLIGNRKLCQEKFREQKTFLERIYQEIKERGQLIEDLMKEMTELNEKLANLKNFKTKLNDELKQVQTEIKALEKVSINCFEDGKVEAESVEFSDWSQKFHDLTSDELTSNDARFVQIRELAEELPVKQVKQLAKLLDAIESLEKQGQKFKIQFEKENQVSALLELVDFEVVIVH